MASYRACVECAEERTIAARGLCRPCHRIASREGRLDDYPDLRGLREGVVPAADRYEDYIFLIDTGRAKTIREAAAIMGITHKALDKAITRHRARMRLTNVEQLSSV